MFFMKSEEDASKDPVQFDWKRVLTEQEIQSTIENLSPLLPAPGGGTWHEITSDEEALLAGQLTRTAIVFFYHTEAQQEDGEHPRRWFFLLDYSINNKPYAAVSLCVCPEDVHVKSDICADCHITGYQNRNVYPTYERDVQALSDFIGIPLPANHMGQELPEYSGTAPKP